VGDWLGAVFTLRVSVKLSGPSAQQSGVPLALIPLVMVAMNLLYFLSAYPFGKLSDAMSHTRLLQWGLVVLIGADIVLALSTHWTGIILGVALWGVHMG
jgi:MFS family permease